MARERIITRTVINYTAEVLVANTKTATLEVVNINVPIICSTKEKAEKYLRKTWSEKDTVPVRVDMLLQQEKLYGMSEEDFIKYAKPMKDRFNYEQDESKG